MAEYTSPEMPSVAAITAILERASREIILPHFRNLAGADVKTKSSPNDFVTVADEKAELFLSAALTDLLPGSAVVGEEAVAADPSVMDRLNQTGDVWVIDPIDGTYNYAHDDPRFAIIVALVRDGIVHAGFFHVPTTGETYAAQLGGDAHRDGQVLSGPTSAAFNQMRAVLYVGKSRAPELYERLKEIKDDLGPRRFDRCAAFEYIALLTGKAHYAVFTRLLPWDHAAGVLMYSAIGGCFGYFDEDPQSGPWTPESRDVPFLLAPDVDTWRMIRDKLTGT